MASPSEELPLRGIGPRVPLGTEIPPEPPHVAARTLSEASRLLAGATAFFFLAFVFAYFYLRSLNVEHMWRPAHVHPEGALGGAMVGCVVASALVTFLAGRQMKRGARSWLALLAAGVVLGLAAVGLQCIEYTVQDFGPTNGAYASVFCIWTAMYLLAVLGAMYWLETDLASELRARRQPASDEGDIAEVDRLIAPGLDAGVFFWAFLAAIGVVTYVTLYLL